MSTIKMTIPIRYYPSDAHDILIKVGITFNQILSDEQLRIIKHNLIDNNGKLVIDDIIKDPSIPDDLKVMKDSSSLLINENSFGYKKLSIHDLLKDINKEVD